MAAQEVDEVPASSIFVPPSIHRPDLIRGASYSHYTPTPALVTTNGGATASEIVLTVGTPCVLGIDEAGRGPVIGPMIYGAFYLPLELHHSLLASTYHFDDSKVLTPMVRTNLMKAACTEQTELFKSCGWAIKSLSARDIGAGMLKNGGSYNLNAQAMDATVEIIQGVIDQGVNLQEIYIDTIGRPETYQRKLERIFPTVKITVEKKADSLFPCVSAASVVAKVTRDVSCELLYEAFAHAQNVEAATDGSAGWGSGYPSDSRCVTWLKSEFDGLFGWGSECRFSWGTVKDILELKSGGGARVDWPAEEDEENMRLSNYFAVGHDTSSMRTEGDQLRSWFGVNVGQEAF